MRIEKTGDIIVQYYSKGIKMKNNKTRPTLAFQKKMFQNSTKTMVGICKKFITNKQIREQNIAFIKAANGKKIRNTSGV